MAVTPGFDGIQPPDVNATSADFKTAYVSGPNNYSTVMNQQMALAVPLGSQLALLTAENAGNPYLNSKRITDQRLGSLANVLSGYNTLTSPAVTSYQPFSQAYGRF